jgi:outer membrane receptor protein involved in Fe transport
LLRAGIVALSVLWWTALAATRSAGTVTGTVTNPQSEFVQGAEMRLEGTAAIATTATTDCSDRYHLRTVGAARLNGEWFGDLKTVDASVGYTFRHGLRLYLEGKNLTDQVTRRIFFGRSDRPSEHEKPGWSMAGGLKFEF